MDARDNTFDDSDRNMDSERNMPDENPRVAALSDLGDFQVAEGYPDPRGWDVMATGGMKVGKVDDLIVDTGEMRTRYLAIKLDGSVIDTHDSHAVLVPVGAARLDDGSDNVVLDSLSATQLAALPAFTSGEITRDYEDSVLGHMPNIGTAAATAGASAAGAVAAGAAALGVGAKGGKDADYYKTHHFDDNRFFNSRDRAKQGSAGQGAMSARGMDQTAGEARVTRSEEELEIGKRKVQAGEASVHKHVETEHVTQPVTVQREEVTIERRPISAGQSGAKAANIGDDNEIRIPITEEEIVVQKNAVVKEELVIKKHMVTEEKTVEADIRKERVDVDRSQERSTMQDATTRDATTRDSNVNRTNP